ncbi:hypothetical protein Tco_0475449 [Tanacetum coccineum]
MQKRTFNPSAVLTRVGLVNTDRSNVSTARSISTVRPVRPVRHTKSLKLTNQEVLLHPTVNNQKELKPDVKTFGVNNMTTIGTRAVVSKGKVENILKKAKWTQKGFPSNPKIFVQIHAEVVDSGALATMSGNKAYLSDYEDFNGGFVAFGSDPKRGDIVPLLPAMLAGAAEDQGEGSAQPAKPHHTYVDPISSTSQPLQSPPHPSPPPHLPLQSPPHSPPHSLHQSLPFSPPHFLPPRSYKAPLPKGNTSGSAKDSMQLKELMKVKSLETALKKKSKKVLISELEGEESEDQGKKIQDIDDDPQVSLVRESMKEKSTDFSTPTKVSGEAQEEEINPTILEAAKTLSKVASQGVTKEKSTDKAKRYRRRVSTKVDSGTASKRGQREGKAPIIEEDIQATHKTKEQIRQEEAGLEEAIKLQAQLDEELTKDVLGKDLPEQDFAKRMAEMVNQRKKHFAEERAKDKREKTMDSVTKFDKLVQQIDTFVPINIEATKAKLKRYGEELQTKTSKKQRFDDKDVPGIGDKVAKVKEEEPVKRTGKRKKQKAKKVEARKGVNVDKSAQEDSKTNKEESVEAMNLTPLTTKSDSVVNWKIFQQGKDVFIDNESNGADTLHELLEPMVLRLHREDLYMLYWTMFDPPLNEDAIWSLPLQQKMYPLSKEACKVMLKMKLLDGKMNEVCYKLLKMIEKQPGIRK